MMFSMMSVLNPKRSDVVGERAEDALGFLGI
jgi:hypothetical protein